MNEIFDNREVTISNREIKVNKSLKDTGRLLRHTILYHNKENNVRNLKLL